MISQFSECLKLREEIRKNCQSSRLMINSIVMFSTVKTTVNALPREHSCEINLIPQPEDTFESNSL